MSCEQMGHYGAVESGQDPQYRCVYCGSWGYTFSWYTEQKIDYENCSCEGTWYEHWMECEDPSD